MKKLNYEMLLPRFSKDYTFEECSADRIEDVVQFIDSYWKKNHAFVVSRKLLDWQFYNPSTGRYNIIVAFHQPTGEIHAMVGVVSTAHFDDQITNPVRWGNMWKARDDAEPGLGLMVEWKKNKMFSAVAEVGVGESATATQLARKTGAAVGVMDHFFFVNPNKKHFYILDHVEPSINNGIGAVCSGKKFRACKGTSYAQIEGDVIAAIPEYKSLRYYENRFLNHPFYEYHATKILDRGKTVGVLFWRLCSANGAVCIRIVDCFGLKGALSGCRENFVELMERYDAEYIDFLCVGMDRTELDEAGFLDRRRNPNWIVPNYFEPFIQANVDVTYSCMAYSDRFKCQIFKGDSDQDRPNLIEAEKEKTL